MSRVITFSRVFPAYHPKASQPTFFIEKMLNSLSDKNNYYFGECERCGWSGSSSVMAGGGQIADTGDYDDVRCPICYSFDIMDLENSPVSDIYYQGKFNPKHHTIRAGHRWKAGENFSPRVWSGRPYASKMITIAPDIEIKKVWDFEIKEDGCVFIDGELYAYSSSTDALMVLAHNDGLELGDFIAWFKYPKPFSGQIICWDDSVDY